MTATSLGARAPTSKSRHFCTGHALGGAHAAYELRATTRWSLAGHARGAETRTYMVSRLGEERAREQQTPNHTARDGMRATKFGSKRQRCPTDAQPAKDALPLKQRVKSEAERSPRPNTSRKAIRALSSFTRMVRVLLPPELTAVLPTHGWPRAAKALTNAPSKQHYRVSAGAAPGSKQHAVHWQAAA